MFNQDILNKISYEISCGSHDIQSLKDVSNNKDIKIILSLGGGAVRGLFANAVFMYIKDSCGLRIDEYWGTSAGAVVGAAYCSGLKPIAILDILSDLKQSDMLDVDYWYVIKNLFSLDKIEGFCSGNRAEQLFGKFLKVQTFEELKTKLYCIATPDDKFDAKVFSSGKLAPVMRASMGMQCIFVPKVINGVEYVDGGIVENVPLRSILNKYDSNSKTLILCINHGYVDASKVKIQGIIQRAWHQLDVSGHRIFESDLEYANKLNIGKLQAYKISTKTYDYSSFDFKQGGDIVTTACTNILKSLSAFTLNLK